MPAYEYACKACGEHIEVVQSFKDGPLTRCPACGGQLRKVFGSIGITFKGSGFYRTDNRASGHRAAARGAGETRGAGEGRSAGEGSSQGGAATGEGSASSGGLSGEGKAAAGATKT